MAMDLTPLLERHNDNCIDFSDVQRFVDAHDYGDDAVQEIYEELAVRDVQVRDDCARCRAGLPVFNIDELTYATVDTLGLFLREISRYPLLTAAEEVELAQSIEQGDQQAKHRMITSNLRLVVSLAKRYRASGMPLLDLIQEGIFGLIRAAEKFDWRKGFKFSTYATWWIRQALQRGVQNRSVAVRLPVHIARREQMLNRVEQGLQDTLGRLPTDVELAKAAGVTLAQVRDVRHAPRTLASLDEPVSAASETPMAAFLASDEQGPDVEVTLDLAWESLRQSVKTLPEPHRTVIAHRYGVVDGDTPMTLKAIGEELGLSPARVRKLEMAALARLAARREVRALRASA